MLTFIERGGSNQAVTMNVNCSLNVARPVSTQGNANKQEIYTYVHTLYGI
jgi:hypothetical protein